MKTWLVSFCVTVVCCLAQSFALPPFNFPDIPCNLFPGCSNAPRPPFGVMVPPVNFLSIFGEACSAERFLLPPRRRMCTRTSKFPWFRFLLIGALHPTSTFFPPPPLNPPFRFVYVSCQQLVFRSLLPASFPPPFRESLFPLLGACS